MESDNNWRELLENRKDKEIESLKAEVDRLTQELSEVQKHIKEPEGAWLQRIALGNELLDKAERERDEAIAEVEKERDEFRECLTEAHRKQLAHEVRVFTGERWLDLADKGSSNAVKTRTDWKAKFEMEYDAGSMDLMGAQKWERIADTYRKALEYAIDKCCPEGWERCLRCKGNRSKCLPRQALKGDG